jgi:hypothetical protein
MIHRIRETRQERNDNTTLERRFLSMCPNDAVHNGITDLVLNFDFIHHGSVRQSDCVKTEDEIIA